LNLRKLKGHILKNDKELGKKKLNLGESRASKTQYIEKMLRENKMQIKYLSATIM
jgi:hypothetical protein